MGCTATLDFTAPAGTHLSFYWTMDEAGAANKFDSTAALEWPLLAGTLAAPGLFSNGTEIQDRVRGLRLVGSPSIVVNQSTSTGISYWYWVKVVSYGSIGVFCGVSKSGGGQNDFVSFLESTGPAATTVELYHWNGPDIADVTTAALSWTLGTWHMVAGTYDKAAQKITIYIDGVQSITLADPFVYPDLLTSLWQLETPNPIGTLPDFIFDELGLCLNGALTAAQITSLYNGGAGVTWPNVTPIVPYP